MSDTLVVKGKRYTFRLSRKGVNYVVTDDDYVYIRGNGKVTGPFEDLEEAESYYIKHYGKPDDPKSKPQQQTKKPTVKAKKPTAKTDEGHRATDELLDRLTAEMDKVYSQALKEMLAKQEKYMAAYEKELVKKKADLEAGKIKREEFEAWQRRQLIGAEWHKQMAKSLADDLTSVDKKALAASGQYIKDAYALNHDFGTFQVESGGTVDTSYTLYDRDTVERLIAERPNLLPKPSIDTKKDKRWNQQHFTSAITQSILQGESIPQAAARLRQVVGMGRNSAVRAARTAITGAENAGRIESYKRAKALGIGMKKEWLATLDKRTRDTHARLDGEKVDVEDRFSNGLKYPGDPSGVAGEVYNCRCTLVPALDGIDQSGAPRDSKLGDMSYEEWKASKMGKAPVKVVTRDARLSNLDVMFGNKSPVDRLGGVAGTVNVEFAQGMADTIEEYADETTASMYYKYGDRLKCKSKNNKGGAYYKPSKSGGGVYINYKAVMKGDTHKTPYETAFHEFAHQIDYVGAKGLRAPKDQYGDASKNRFLSVIYKNGALEKAMREDWADIIARSKSKTEGGAILELEMKYTTGGKIDYRSAASISDALEYLSGISYPLGAGHGAKYYDSDQYRGPMECFANFSAALASNPEALKAIEATMPKSLEVVKEIIAYASGRMDDGKV